ncbi:MAG: OmpA family protein [Sulfuricaulis sp.]|nr:OmpA family protein [Sulfuricaulis sp.]
MKKTLQLAVFAAVASLAGQSALAQSVTHSPVTAGYVGDSRGIVERDSSGNCLRSSSWTKEMATANCDADLLPKMAAITPEPAPVPAAKPVMTPTVEKITLREDALFDNGKADLRAKGKAELDALAARMSDKNIALENVAITGHASAPGTNNFNQLLSERRAEAVKAYLVQKGIDPTRIFNQGMGEMQPIASNDTSEGQAQNRRVEVEIKAQRTSMSSN